MATGYVSAQTTVYYGPSSTTYPSSGSYAGPAETVDILWKEGNWYYIEYQSGSYRKRMYIPTSAVSQVSGTVSTYTANLTAKYVGKGGTTYNGPSSSTYASAGSVENYEAVSFLSDKRENGYALIEYNIGGGQKKRAWFPYAELGIKLGVDTYAKINSQTMANAIKNAGYSFVGRYYYSDGTYDHGFDSTEAGYLSAAGLDVFIYFQNGATGNASYYTAAQGTADAEAAYNFAREVGQPAGTMIYFAVELNATSSQISGCISDYFNAVVAKMSALGTANNCRYNVGVYGCHAVCSNLTVTGVVSRTAAWAWQNGITYRGWDNRQISTKTGAYEVTINGTNFNVVVSKLQHAGGWSC